MCDKDKLNNFTTRDKRDWEERGKTFAPKNSYDTKEPINQTSKKPSSTESKKDKE